MSADKSRSIAYYPGCTMKTTGQAFEKSAYAVTKALGIQMRELERWNCCGTVFSLTTDDTMHHIATIRNMVRVEEMGESEVLTLCSMCYNTLKRSNEYVSSNPVILAELNDFMYKENLKYSGKVKVRHLLELLRDDVTWARLSAKLVNPLTGIKLAPYYGCALVRPAGAGVDSLEDPSIMENLISSLGAEPVAWPSRLECCGSYHTIGHSELVFERTERIVGEALKVGADAIILSCPLCEFNIGSRQPEVAEKIYGFKEIPVLYFTQVMGLALGIAPEELAITDKRVLSLIQEKVEA